MSRNRSGLSARSLAFLGHVQNVLDALQEHWPLTLRQLYYQLVAAQLIENAQREYKKLSTLLTKARLAGLVPWDAVEDRSRSELASGGWSDAGDFVRDQQDRLLRGYQRDLLQTQDVALEVWVEKDALSHVIHRAAFDYRVPVVVARGFSSISLLNSCRERVLANVESGKRTLLLYFGDLDPSGWEMLPAMLETLQVEMDLGTLVEGRRCALLAEQVREFELPHDPSALKWSDSRAAKYVAKHGRVAVELDALAPATLQGIVRRSIEAALDMTRFEEERAAEAEDREVVAGHRARVLTALGGGDV